MWKVSLDHFSRRSYGKGLPIRLSDGQGMLKNSHQNVLMKRRLIVINESETGEIQTSTQWQYASRNMNFFKFFNVRKGITVKSQWYEKSTRVNRKCQENVTLIRIH